MDWYVIDKEYISYLSKYDYRVGFVDYGNRLKIHIGILLTINGFQYYVPVSSAKPKHQKMSNGIDFYKIQDMETGYLYAVININNMIPVPEDCATQLKYDKVGEFREFANEKEKTDYIYLLQKEKKIIDSVAENLMDKARKLYKKRIEMPESSLAKRCCDFVLLEEKSKKYADDILCL